MADYVRCSIYSVSDDDFTALGGYNFHFAECIVSELQGASLFGEEFGRRFVLSMRATPHLCNRVKDLVVNACFCKESDAKKQRSNDGEQKIFALETFLQSHGLQSGQMLWVRKVSPMQLQTVLVGISSDEGFLWAQNSLASFLLDALRYGPIAARGNETVFLNCYECGDIVGKTDFSELHILQCQPVLQGSITAQTSIIISKIMKSNSSRNLGADESNSIPRVMQSLDNYYISDFTRNLPRVRERMQQIYDLGHEKVFQLTAYALDWKAMKGLGVTCDDNSRLFVHVTTLIDYCLFHGSWVKISASQTSVETIDIAQASHHKGGFGERPVVEFVERQEDSQEQIKMDGTGNENCKQGASGEGCIEENTVCHIVQVFAADAGNNSNQTSSDLDVKNSESIINATCLGETQIENGVIYMTPLLFFNIFGRNSFCGATPKAVHVSPICKKTDTRNICSGFHCNADSTATKSRNERPPFAKEAHIGLVNSPFYKIGDSFDGALAVHFKVPKLLTVGDIFHIQHSWLDDNDNRRSEEQLLRDVPVYFQVTNLSCQDDKAKTCFVDTEHTSLYQRGSVHSYVPSSLVPILSHTRHSDGLSYWQQMTCPGLDSYILTLERAIKPYLKLSTASSLFPNAILLTGPPGSGKRTVVLATSRRLSLHMFEVSCYDLIGESVAATEARVRNTFQKAVSCSPCVLLLQGIEALGKDKEGINDEPRIAIAMLDCINGLLEDSDWPVVVIAMSSSPNDISAETLACFLHEVKIEAPTEDERFAMLHGLAKMACVGTDVSFKQLAKRTAGMVLGDFMAVFNYASNTAVKRLVDGCPKKNLQTSSDIAIPLRLERDLCQMGVSLSWQDFEESLDVLQSSMSDAIGAPKIPSVKWEDVGGLADVKAEILDTVQLPLQHPELFAAGLRRSGVLLYGPPGTGKTLLAKAVATECSLNFLSVKGPELINMYVGQSEQNIREVFARAQSARPCVIFFDELDSLAPNRGRSGDSGGVMDRVVSQLLAELDGLHKACDVFVIGATNRPDLLDPALLRPGRFDKLLYVGVSKGREAQVNILKALTRKFNLDPDLRLENIVALCPPNLTGADFYALCSDAMLHAVKDVISLLEAGKSVSGFQDEITVTERDFQTALDNLVPSVSLQELKRYQDLQEQFTVRSGDSS